MYPDSSRSGESDESVSQMMNRTLPLHRSRDSTFFRKKIKKVKKSKFVRDNQLSIYLESRNKSSSKSKIKKVGTKPVAKDLNPKSVTDNQLSSDSESEIEPYCRLKIYTVGTKTISVLKNFNRNKLSTNFDKRIAVAKKVEKKHKGHSKKKP